MRTLNSYQVGGDHYASKDIQPWDVMQAWMTKESFCWLPSWKLYKVSGTIFGKKRG
jgi:hypothetical protein